MKTTFIINFRCKTFEEWKKDNTIINDEKPSEEKEN